MLSHKYYDGILIELFHDRDSVGKSLDVKTHVVQNAKDVNSVKILLTVPMKL